MRVCCLCYECPFSLPRGPISTSARAFSPSRRRRKRSAGEAIRCARAAAAAAFLVAVDVAWGVLRAALAAAVWAALRSALSQSSERLAALLLR